MIRHIIGEALSALSYYRLRSALTMLSIIWGVASLMLLLSYGQGFERALTQAFLQIGKDLVVVFPGQTSMQAGGERSGRPVMLELKDVNAIQEGVPTVEAVSPEFRHFLPLGIQRADPQLQRGRRLCRLRENSRCRDRRGQVSVGGGRAAAPAGCGHRREDQA